MPASAGERGVRIAAGGFTHETSTFTPVRTTRADFDTGYGFFRGDEIFEHLTNVNVPTAGFIEGGRIHGFDVVPLLWTFAYSSGLSDRETYEEIKNELLARLKAALPLDGVLLDQHGAFVTDGIDDADGDVIQSVRDLIGPECPIVVVFDLHSNHTQKRLEAADAIVGFDTFPHVDEAERGLEAAGLIVRIIRGEIKPTSALVHVPLFVHPTRQVSGIWPWREATAELHRLEDEPGVLTATIATGFPFADVPDRGPSVIVVTDNDAPAAERHARRLANWLWNRRPDWLAPLVTVDEALDRGEREDNYPIVLADHADNTGGSAPGDSTEVLRTFLTRGLDRALLLYMVDPESAATAHAAGVGARVELDVGGKSHPIQGPPVRMSAEVIGLSDGRFRYDGPMLHGLDGDLGLSAGLKQDGVTVVCVSRPMQPYDFALSRTLGIDCSVMRYICVKSAAHFRAAFDSLGGAVINVDAAGVHTFDLQKLPFRKKREPMFGIDEV